MAKYPITTQRTMPGISGGFRGRINFETGEADVWRQIGNLAGTVGDVATKFYVQQAETQLMDASLAAGEEIEHLSQRLRENQDEDTYHKELDKSIKTMQQFRPKNGLAAKGYDVWIKKQTPAWRKGVNESIQERLNNKWADTENALIEESIKNKTIAKLLLHEKAGLALGRTDEATSGKVIRDTRHKMEVDAFRTFAFTNPEAALKDLEDNKLEGATLLTTNDLLNIRNIATTRLADDRKDIDAQQNVVKNEVISKIQAHDSDTATYINDNIVDADERYTWWRRYEDEMKRFSDGKDIVTDQRVKHEILDYAAAINWPDKNISAQSVLDRANDARYPFDGTEPTIDDAAYDEIRDIVRREREDKPPFTESYVEKGIGELMTGAPSSMLGIPLPTLRTREDYMKHATNLFGRYATKIPGVMEAINAKFPPAVPIRRKEELTENPAHDFDGEIIGSYNPDGSITLNRLGVVRLYELAGRDIEMARRMAIENRYFIPERVE